MKQKIPNWVPARLQLDMWWLDHDVRPVPKAHETAKLAPKGAGA